MTVGRAQAREETTRDANNQTCQPEVRHYQAGGGPAQAPTPLLAERTLGWKPKTKLADGLAKAHEWAERRIATWS